MNIPPQRLSLEIRMREAISAGPRRPAAPPRREFSRVAGLHRAAPRRPDPALPPPVAPPPAQDDPAELVKRPDLTPVAAPDSMPVLSAFRQFLETERIRARNRMVVLSLFFVAVVVTLGATGMLIGVHFMGKARHRIDQLTGELQQVRARTRSLTALDTNAVMRTLATETSRLGSRLEQAQAASIEKARSTMQRRVGAYETELAALRDVIRLLEKENASRRRDLRTINSRWTSLTEDMEIALGEIARLRRGGPVTDGGTGDEVPVRRSSPAAPPSVALSLKPAGARRPMAWLLPIPE